MPPLRILLAPLVLASSFASTGCAILHELKPHRLSRWNREVELGRDTSNFSVADDEATRLGAARGRSYIDLDRLVDDRDQPAINRSAP